MPESSPVAAGTAAGAVATERPASSGAGRVPLGLVGEVGRGTQAALKAWETRRRNQAAKKRTEAAKQPWETSRENGQKRKGNKAAKQAWRTRRNRS